MATTFATRARAATAAVLAGSMLATAIPAEAQRYPGRHQGRYHDGIDAGDVIAGAVIIGGLAAILSAGGRDRDRGYDRGYDRGGDPRYDRGSDGYYDGYDWDRFGGSREAVERCVTAVERRGGRRDDLDVRRVTGIDRIRGGYRVNGVVAADYGRGYPGDWRDRDDRGRGYGDDRRGYGRDGRQRYDERGRFSCTVRYGRVQDVDLRGI